MLAYTHDGKILFYNNNRSEMLQSWVEDFKQPIRILDIIDDNAYIYSEEEMTISTIGENINFNRFNYLENENGFIEHYIHNQYGEGIGKIGVILSVKTDLKLDQIQTLLKKLCMHIAATSPLSIECINRVTGSVGIACEYAITGYSRS